MTTPEKLAHARVIEGGLRMIRSRMMRDVPTGPVPDAVLEIETLLDRAGELVDALRDEIETTLARRRPANAVLATPSASRRETKDGTIIIRNGAEIAIH